MEGYAMSNESESVCEGFEKGDIKRINLEDDIQMATFEGQSTKPLINRQQLVYNYKFFFFQL